MRAAEQRGADPDAVAATDPEAEGRRATDDPGPPDFVLARFGELQLKGGNRKYFERTLVRNVRAATAPLAAITCRREHGQLVVRPEARAGAVARRMQEVFGIASVSPAWEAPRDPEGIAATAVAVVGAALAGRPAGAPVPFRVRVKRADKRFPVRSMELAPRVADAVMLAHGDRLRVDLTAADLTLGVAIRSERVYVHAETLPGAGGLPVGTLGRGMALLSGGIDSPVAAWMAMKRGLELRLVTFQATPFLGAAPGEKVLRIARRLARWQRTTKLLQVPFEEIQLAVRAAAPAAYRTVLYRRMMHRVAERLARREKAGALVTGDSLGQVASQTLENLGAAGAATTLPLLRPLIGMDKRETIERARRIGTYALSIEPAPDCCVLFQPDQPTLRATPERARLAERDLDVDALVDAAAARAKQMLVEPE